MLRFYFGITALTHSDTVNSTAFSRIALYQKLRLHPAEGVTSYQELLRKHNSKCYSLRAEYQYLMTVLLHNVMAKNRPKVVILRVSKNFYNPFHRNIFSN